MLKYGYVYIMTNMHHTVLYVGVTSNLLHRVSQHKDHTFKNSFTDKYNIEKLVYYETFESIEHAIAKEKQIKKYRREKKEGLINEKNIEWKDLWNELDDW